MATRRDINKRTHENKMEGGGITWLTHMSLSLSGRSRVTSFPTQPPWRLLPKQQEERTSWPHFCVREDDKWPSSRFFFHSVSNDPARSLFLWSGYIQITHFFLAKPPYFFDIGREERCQITPVSTFQITPTSSFFFFDGSVNQKTRREA